MKKLLACIVLVLACLTMTFMACQPIDSSSTEGPATIQDARTFLKAMYKDAATVTPSDYERVAMLSLTGTDGKDYLFPVEWSAVVTTEGAPEGLIKVTKNEDGKAYTIDVDEDAKKDYEYTLTATIKNAEGTDSLTFEFKYTLPKFHVSTYAEYVALEKDKAVTVEGIITAITSKTLKDSNNCLYVNDLNNEGGYYVYQMSEDPLTESFENLNDASKKYALAVGMKVQVKGVKDNYSGTLEIKSPKVTILDAGVTEVTPVDFTEIYKAAAAKKDLKATDLVYKQALLVKISGVEITGQDESSGYYKFKLDGLESYVRISSSVCPLNAADTEAFKKLHSEKFGNIADVCGVVCVYDGAFYLTPVDVNAFSNFTLPPKTPAEQVAFEKEALTVTANITEDGQLELDAKGTAYTDVTIAWSLDKTYPGVTLNKNILTVELQETAQTIKLTATLTNGEVSETKDFEIAIDAKETVEYVPVAITAPVEGTYKLYLYQTNIEKTLYFDGTVTTAEYLGTTEKTSKAADVVLAKSGDGYTMTVDGKFIEVYMNSSNKQRLKLFDKANGTWAWNEELKLFTWTIDTKTYYLGTFNKYDTMSASDISYLTKDPSIIGKTQFVAYLATLQEKGNVPEPTDEEKLAAIVKKVSTTATEDFELDTAATWTVKSGDAITIEGNTAKVTRPAAGAEDATVVLTATLGSATQDVTITVKAMPGEATLKTIAEVKQLDDDTEVIIKGVVTSIDTAWDTSFKNMSVVLTDDTGSILVYRLATQVNLGDTITVTGKVGTYKEKQIAQGATAVIDIVHVCSEWNDATCEKAETCKVCGKVKEGSTPLGHIDENNDNVCDRCGSSMAALSSEVITVTGTTGTLSGKSISWTGTNFTVTNNQASSTTAIRNTDSSEFRVYKSSELVITANNGKKISKIVVTCVSSSYADALISSLGDGLTGEKDGTKVTITLTEEADSITITAGAQFRITQVEILYAE